MKKILYLLPILLVFVLAGCNSNKTETSKNKTTPTKTDKPEEKMSDSQLTDGIYKINPTMSMVKWEGGDVIVSKTHAGIIGVKSGMLEVVDGVVSKGEIIIDMKSITSDEDLDSLVKHLNGEDFFDSEKFPESKLTFDDVKESDTDVFMTESQLQIKELTNPQSFKFTVKEEGKKITLISDFEIDRTVWEVKYGSGQFFKEIGDKAIKDEIKYNLSIVAEME